MVFACVDLRVTSANEIYFIEATHPILAYPQLIERISRTGLKTARE